MSGHSRWANIKHRKEGADKKRGVAFAKISKELIVAARLGGSDPASNARLRISISKARAANMPRDNIERAVKKGAGELEGTTYEEILYEIYAPGGVGILVEGLTDKKSRTTPEIKSILTKYGGNLAMEGAVSRNFTRCGVIVIESQGKSEDEWMEFALDAGADDFVVQEGFFEIRVPVDRYAALQEKLSQKEASVVESGIKFVPLPGTEVEVKDADQAAKIQKFLDALEDHDDIQAVSTNWA
ncbi:MAG TPA: YebC/PmpR family DNA-binding transcriptional regulator [Leptospiraceae bacterium]|nr:YebC/PmpR family DNA-binding transcriptional regulator [Leptospiraceae bacterium]HQI20961.1 YebC/PmpR family DNA-binding transcriptional regulator [Leptospiraceae bacterium]